MDPYLYHGYCTGTYSCNHTDNISPAFEAPTRQQDPIDVGPPLGFQKEGVFQTGDCESGRDTHIQSSLYIRLKALFIPKSKLSTLPTPPASPENSKPSQKLCADNIFRDAHEHSHSSVTGKSCISFSAESTPAVSVQNQIAPLTPESIDLRRGRAIPSLTHIIKDFALGEKQTNNSHIRDKVQTWDDIPQKCQNGLEAVPCRFETDADRDVDISLLQSRFGERLADSPLTQDDVVEHDEGVHLLDNGRECSKSGVQSIRCGKLPMPPIRWDLLVDDISWPIDPGAECHNSNNAQLVLYPGMEGDQDFYGLQFALELSRRDRRKLMNSDPESVGEYSKSREAWKILHLNYATPSQEEYWFQWWLHWHYDLEEKAAYKLARGQKEAKFKQYQLVSPWPISPHRRAARNSRRADEDLHPTLRLVRHRTRSAPGRSL